ncbi:MAG: hypothetical protein QOH39_1139 [Verrucomicrobiota bacterium]|jgi:endogenous inhibitor of DNA gyrase (YacG/DUF329 family)
MPFSEATKLAAKRRAHFSCVVCHQAFVEVHHITPQADGGDDDLDNAAPLCASCHDLFGGNPDKRKQIRQMRDLWYELCETRFRDSPSAALAQDVDAIKEQQRDQGARLTAMKELLERYYARQMKEVAAASTAKQVSFVSGISIPQRLMIKCPKTGKPVYTGVAMSEGAFKSATLHDNAIGCPQCGEQHVWNKEDAFFETK